MGSPLGPVLAKIFMCHFEEKWVLSNNTHPSVWLRHVDDTFTLFDNNNAANQFLHYLNSCHANIKFTVKFEESNTMSFLDILLITHNQAFLTSIYRKRYLLAYTKWDSPPPPRKYRINLICTLTFSCFCICSSPSLLSSSWDELRKLSFQNGCPSGVLNYNINDILNRRQNIPNQPVANSTLWWFLTKQMKACINKFYGCFDLQFEFFSKAHIY